jgi:hypothetical protein
MKTFNEKRQWEPSNGVDFPRVNRGCRQFARRWQGLVNDGWQRRVNHAPQWTIRQKVLTENFKRIPAKLWEAPHATGNTRRGRV